jgi:hypothetical protein
MQGRVRPELRLRIFALLCAAALGLLVPAVHAAHPHAHAGHGIAIVATAPTDTGHATARSDTHGDTAAVLAAAYPSAGRRSTADPCATVRSHPAQTPQVRGPPAQSPA